MTNDLTSLLSHVVWWLAYRDKDDINKTVLANEHLAKARELIADLLQEGDKVDPSLRQSLSRLDTALKWDIELDAKRILAELDAGSVNDSRAVIPASKRTSPITKKKAAALLGKRGDHKRAVEWLNKCIEDGIIRYIPASRQSGFYHLDDFPEEHWKKLTGK